MVGQKGTISENVEQNFYLADSDVDKLRFLEHIMLRKQQSPSKGGTIIFVNTRARADSLVKHLVSKSIAATCIHGQLVPDERRENMMLFAKGHCEVLVATGAFGRGLDLCVAHVINFDFPHSMDECVPPCLNVLRAMIACIVAPCLFFVRSRDDVVARYVQQCGRTGRGGALGVATTIVPSIKEKHTNGQFYSDMYQFACSEV